ncbi:putative purine permease 11 isoform X2 [Silene latifolia]|uniref:putative purine permease 11 isoform X2 n=1 Tax=Silene latifolia TaxID=37657 RepID=UPI003D76BCC3
MLCNDIKMIELSPNFKLTRKRWCLFVALSIAFLLVGQTAANLLGRFYYAESGSSLFLVTLVQTAGFPMLCIPLILIPSDPKNNPVPSNPIDKKYITLVYLCLGVLLAGDNLLFSVGAMYLPASTYSLINATQLAFNAIFSFFLNSQKFTSMILNSVVALTISSGLLAMGNKWSAPEGVSRLEYAIGFLCTLGASAVYSLLLSLMQLSFQKVLKAESFDVVMRMQIYTSFVATIISMAGLLASGQWRNLGTEMENFDTGAASYVMTLVWSGISWQICCIGVVGLIFLVSSLFSNVTSTAALAITPIAALIVFHDPMTGVKGLAMVLSVWGFATYFFQIYLDIKRGGTVSQTQISADDSDFDKVSSCVISVT